MNNKTYYTQVASFYSDVSNVADFAYGKEAAKNVFKKVGNAAKLSKNATVSAAKKTDSFISNKGEQAVNVLRKDKKPVSKARARAAGYASAATLTGGVTLGAAGVYGKLSKRNKSGE